MKTSVSVMTRRKPCIVGNYRFTGKVLGKGNFARVEEACHELLGIKVAIKIMDLNSIKEDYVIRNLFREARIMAKIKHPCIVSLFETMQKADNIYYLVTEVVNGGDLCTYVKAQRNGKLDERSTKFFAQQFVSALSYMHQRGIVHRDLKMENVMLNSIQNQIKIVDFGLSNEWTAECPLKTHCGSPEYAAPELFVTSKVYGPEVDLWSLGIILYGMMVGQLPFISTKSPSITSQERRKLLVAQINKGLSTPQRKAIAGFTFEYRNLMSRLLSADTTKRITIREMLLHPWVTENGKRFVKTNPTRKISTVFRNKIISNISALSSINCGDTCKRIKEEPFGKAGGMYNILVHRHTLKTFTPELLTRSLSETVTLNIGRKKEREEMPPRLVHTAREEEERRIHTTLRPHTMSTASSDMSRTRTVLTTKIPHAIMNTSVHSRESRVSTPKIITFTPKHSRPQSVQLGKASDLREEKRPHTSAFHKRQEYSAIVASRFNQQSAVKSVKSKKSDRDEPQSTTLKRRLEYLHKMLPPRGQESASRAVKISDSNIPRKSPRTPASPRRKLSSDQASNHARTSPNNKSQKNTAPSELPPFQAFMQYITKHNEVDRGTADIHSRKNNKQSSQKSGVSRYSDTPIQPRKTAARIKLKVKRPLSCHSSIENPLPASVHKSLVPVNDSQTAQPSITSCKVRPDRPFLEAYRGLCNLASGGRTVGNIKTIHNIPPNRLQLVREPKPGSARGDFATRMETLHLSPRSRRPSPKPSPSQPDNTKITKNILNYLQRNAFYQQ